jgi:hypothetical protein
MISDEKKKIAAYISRNYGLDATQAQKLVEELPLLFDFTVEHYIRNRHLSLQQQGQKNCGIYKTIAGELGSMVFSAEQLSERQIRRIIYG